MLPFVVLFVWLGGKSDKKWMVHDGSINISLSMENSNFQLRLSVVPFLKMPGLIFGRVTIFNRYEELGTGEGISI